MQENAGTLIVTGNIEPCANIGTEMRFTSIQAPWNDEVFLKAIYGTVLSEISCASCLKKQASNLPCHKWERKALQQSVGLKAWMLSASSKYARMFKNYTHNKDALLFLDTISLNIVPVVFIWPDKDPYNQAAAKKFENILIRVYGNFLKSRNLSSFL